MCTDRCVGRSGFLTAIWPLVPCSDQNRGQGTAPTETKTMRILISSLNPALWLAEALSGQPDLEVSVLAASRVDLGDFSCARAEAPPGARYQVHALPVFPLRPYPYSRYRGGLTRLLQRLQPDIIYHLGEPSELNTAQVVAAAGQACPEASLTLFSFENVRRDWSGFARCLRGLAERYVLP